MLDEWRERLAARMPKSRVARGIITLASGTAVGQVITICAMPIVTRLYTPGQIGIISIFLSFFGFWASLLSWRYESALLVAKDEAESHLVFKLGMFCVWATSVLAIPALFALQRSNTFGFGLLPWWAAFVAFPVLLGYGRFMMYRSWALRAGLVKRIASASVARTGAKMLTRVGLGLFGFGVPALFVAELFGAWSPVAALSHAVRRRYLASRPKNVTWRDLKILIVRYSKYAKYELPSVTINQVASLIPVPLLASLYGASVAGWFGMAWLVVAVPDVQLGRAAGDTFQMEFARYIREQKYSEGKQLFYKLMRKLTFLGLFPFSAILVLAPWLVPYIFGEAWKEMGVMTAIIVPWMYVSLIASALSRLLSVLQVQEYKLIYDTSSVILVFGAYTVAKVFSLNFYAMVVGFSIAGVVSNVTYLAVLIWVIRRKLPCIGDNSHSKDTQGGQTL